MNASVVDFQQMKSASIIVLVLLAGFCCGRTASADTLNPFVTDGCTGFVNGPPEAPELWLHCCVEHDFKYWLGGTYTERLDADKGLRACVGELMFRAVRVGGTPDLDTPWRWGYGWVQRRGYKPLTSEEKVRASEISPGV